MTGTNKPRYILLDVLRGLCVVSMVLYHTMYDVVNILGFPISWFWELPGYLWQQSICWTFILLSGFCWSLSRQPLRRGLILTVCGGVVTLATRLAMPDEMIQYGVLTLLGLSALLACPLRAFVRRLPVKLPGWLGLFLSALLFFLLRDVPRGFLGFEGLKLFPLPPALYRHDALAVLGFPSLAFVSSDYFPLIPWFFLYLTGICLWRVLSRREKLLHALEGRPHSQLWDLFQPLAWIGRHSLVIYLAHQPVLLAIFLLLPH